MDHHGSKGMSALSPGLRRDALAWLEDCFEDIPQSLSNKEIIAAVNRHYDGGWPAFAVDSVPS